MWVVLDSVVVMVLLKWFRCVVLMFFVFGSCICVGC